MLGEIKKFACNSICRAPVHAAAQEAMLLSSSCAQQKQLTLAPLRSCLVKIRHVRVCSTAQPQHRPGRVAATTTKAFTTERPTTSSSPRRSTSRPRHDQEKNRSHDTDYVVIGSGIGGLCCGALLARYGYRVTVVESHYLPGGAAHSFQVGGYTFDAGPSFHMGLADPPGTSKNPLAQVLELLDERVECKRYSQWILHEPQGRRTPIVADGSEYAAMIERIAGPEALAEWRRLEAAMAPLQRGAATFPAAAIRSDPGMLLTAARFFGPQLLLTGLVANKLTGPFSSVVDQHVRDPWLKSMLDLECFVLSGMLAADTLTAEMVFMFMERGQGRNRIDYPVSGCVPQPCCTDSQAGHCCWGAVLAVLVSYSLLSCGAPGGLTSCNSCSERVCCAAVLARVSRSGACSSFQVPLSRSHAHMLH
eukprot:GHRQ01014357.1.p1 GENE.GHRQ01014357.1~~GHRQ01014357.1.p1  ORF type:complete len:420 (+),score=78.47 GHRQ01014357.1:84-1343(+)